MKKLILANWKMFKTLEEIQSFAKEFHELMASLKSKANFGIAVPSIYLTHAKEIFGEEVEILAQDAHFKKEGAFTGNISYSQLLDCGIKGAIIGHSERRQMFNDTDEVINQKTKVMLENNMKVILCIGETAQEYDEGKSFEVIWNQTKKALKGVTDKKLLKNLVIAYEPVWAIGTGKVPTGLEVDKLIGKLRAKIKTMYKDEKVADKLKILYGGSVNDVNAKEFFSQENIDGALVGSFALKADNFVKLIKIGAR